MVDVFDFTLSSHRRFLSARAGSALAGAAIVCLGAIAMRVVFKVDCDDAYIHLRIGQHWASGHGPGFNVGARVEASTSPLWLALLTLALRVGLPGWGTACALGLIAAAGCGAGVSLLAREL